MRRLFTASLTLPLMALALFGCGDSGRGGRDVGQDPDGPQNNAQEPSPEMVAARADYLTLCASCHGDEGQGMTAPAVAGWERGLEALTASIDATMPLGNTGACVGACAESLARYILTLPAPNQPIACDEPRFAAQRLRLLTRREYANTVKDLLGSVTRTCSAVADCDFAQQSCQESVCTDDPCGLHTFVFDPGGQNHGSVHVAGDFNGWPGSVAEGGWEMAWMADAGVWITKRTLPTDQPLQYKFVLNNNQWIADPANPNGVDDGFGGRNSSLTVSCSAPGSGNDPGDITADFPPENRPSHFPFDNNAQTGRVTAIHVEEYMNAAETLAQNAVADLDALAPCLAQSADAACKRQFVTDFGLRAFRRPLGEPEVTRYTDLIDAQDTLNDGLMVALQVMLSSPHFLYRTELGTAAGDHFRLTPWETATALSYMFWGTMPDAALFEAAAQNNLNTPDQLEAQARRLLADARAQDLLGTFAIQWLGIERVLSADKHPDLYHDFNRQVRQSMLDETRRFVTHVIFDGTERYDELLTADYTFANDALASFYGTASQGPALQQTPYPQGHRAGILGHGSVLASTAHSDQTSPVLRGLFVRERLLCQTFGAPPANAGGVPDIDPNATTRERFRQHSSDPACRSCHQYIDEVGFGFERFDPVGRWRTEENGQPIDPSGDMADVEGLRTDTQAPFDSLPGLARILAESQAAHDCFATQVYRFTMGAMDTPEDACALAELQAQFAAADHNIQALLIAIVRAPGFTTRRAP